MPSAAMTRRRLPSARARARHAVARSGTAVRTAAAGLARRLRLGVEHAAGVDLRRSRAAAAARSRSRCYRRCAADAGLRQHQAHLAGGRVVAGDLGHHRAHLLVAGRHEEGRRAAIGLRADDVEAGFGMRELGRSVRRHRAAGMQVGIDQRRQRRRRLDRRVERHPQLAQHAKIRPEAGRDHDPIDKQRHRAARDPRRHPKPVAVCRNALRREGREHLESPRLDRAPGRQPERPALGQLVIDPAAEQPVEPVAPQRPGHPRPRRRLPPAAGGRARR